MNLRLRIRILSLIAIPLLASVQAKGGVLSISNLSVQELVENYFLYPDGRIQFRNVAASDHSCFALFADGHSVGRDKDTNEFLLPDDGIIMSTGNPQDFHINDSDKTTTDFGIITGDINLEHELPPRTKVFDSCFIQFEFSCPEEMDAYTHQVSFDYIFGSEEYYKQQTDTSLNDVFGFFLNGENIALVPDEHVGASTNNVNEQQNSDYFIDNRMEGRLNATSPYNAIEADGFTTKLTAHGVLRPGWNIIKLAIGDTLDGNLDSWVLLEAETFRCAPMPLQTVESSSATITTLSPSSMTPTPKPSSATIATLFPSNTPTLKPSKSLLRSSSSSPTLNKSLNLPSSPEPVGTAQEQQKKARIPRSVAFTLMVCVGLFALAIPTIAYFVTR